MAGFVGYIVHANDVRWPWDKVANYVTLGLSPQATWDAIPEAAKWQIILTIAFFEFWRELWHGMHLSLLLLVTLNRRVLLEPHTFLPD